MSNICMLERMQEEEDAFGVGICGNGSDCRSNERLKFSLPHPIISGTLKDILNL